MTPPSVANRVDGYGRERNQLAVDGTSRLSPHLRFGLVSPRQVAAAVTRDAGRGAGRAGDRESFVNELLWRDFYTYVLYHQPESAWSHVRPEFDRFRFEDDPDDLAAWRQGRTGYPLVDAGNIRHWVPELAQLSPPAIFAPWRADPADLGAAGVRLGADYPHPIIDHATARERALARYREVSPRGSRPRTKVLARVVHRSLRSPRLPLRPA